MLGAFDYIMGTILILVAIAIIAIVLFQQGKRQGLSGAISGGADTFLSKGKARTVDSTLLKWTKYVAILFFVLILIVNVVNGILG